MSYRLLLYGVFAIALGALLCCDARKKPSVGAQKVWQLLESGVDKSFRDNQGRNLLHLAILSEDRELIRHVDSLYPGLRNRSDSTGHVPVHTAVARCSVATLELLDTLGYDFSRPLHRQQFSYFTATARHVASDRFNEQTKRTFRDSTVVGDRHAEAVYAWVVSELGESAWPDGTTPSDIIRKIKHELKHGHTKAAHAHLDLLRRHPAQLKRLLRSTHLIDSSTAAIVTRLPLPVGHDNGRYLFEALRTGYPALTKAFIEQGAVVNNMSVCNREVRSALSVARALSNRKNIELLEQAGATDSLWYELLIPGFWPTISSLYDPALVWHAVVARDDTVVVHGGTLDRRYFRVQRNEYWFNAPRRALFLIATNRPTGIESCRTVVYRPYRLTPDNPLHVKISADAVYELSAPPVAGTVLRLQHGKLHQDLLQYHPESYHISTARDSSAINAVWVLWAGDIDGDLRLDLLIAGPSFFSGGHTAYPAYLALSSLATGGQLVGWADESKVYASYHQFAQNEYGRRLDEQHMVFPFMKRSGE